MQTSLCVDLGSYSMRSGYSGNDAPEFDIPSVIGHVKYKPSMINCCKHSFIGRNASGQPRRGILTLKYPIQNGIVVNWDEMELLWNFTFDQLDVRSEECDLMIVEPSNSLKSNRNSQCQLMFELYKVESVGFGNPSVMTLYSAGRYTGLVVDCGEASCRIVPIFQSFVVSNGMNRLNVGGQSINRYLGELLNKKGHTFNTNSEFEMIREMKESIACVNCQNTEMEQAQYELPDGTTIDISAEKYECVECLFNPILVGNDYQDGISEMILNSLSKCPIDTRRDFYNNIILSGGTSLIENFTDRLSEEVKTLLPHKVNYQIVAPPERLHSSWIGGSIVSSMGHMKTNVISKYQYEECGCTAIDRHYILEGL